MARFDRARATADRLITRNGFAVTLSWNADGTPPDSSKPWEKGADIPKSVTVRIARFPQKARLSPGKEIDATDEQFLLAASECVLNDVAFTPDVTMQFLITDTNGDSIPWQILECAPLHPNDQEILFTIRARAWPITLAP